MKDIIAAIEQQERLAASGSLSEERSDALDRYQGRPYGDEKEGRSQVVMRDVADTIEWIKPSLLKVFAAGDEVVRFDPVGPEDEEQAEQETDWCNHVLMQKNNGFMVLHDWFHDALLQKNGYVMVQDCEERVANRERFEGLTDDEFALLMQSDDVELVEHTESVQPLLDPLGNPIGEAKYHDAVVRRKSKYGYIKVTNIPPERVLVASDWPSVTFEGCPFLEVIDWPTISELRQDGFDVDDDINDTSQSDDEWQEERRSVELDTFNREDVHADPATRRVKTRYVWMRWDADGDGIAELRHLVVVGKTILNGKEGEEDDLIPVAALTPMRQPHEHHGMSVHDIVEDLQRIRTVLMRGFLDNMYLANNGRYAVDANNVNLDDLLNPRPGGLVRTNGAPGTAIAPLIHQHAGGDILQAIEFVDNIRENRTGVTKYNQGLDSNSLNKTATGVQQIMNASQQRIELIARVFAETGVKALMLIIHAMSVKHTRQAEMVKLRNKWVQIDPRAWKSRRDLTTAVGLGTGNKDQMLGHLQMILGAQAQAAQLGIATPKNIYNALVRLTQNAGFKQAEEFWTDPETQQQAPQGPPPEVQKEQLKQQGEAQKFQAEAVLEQQRLAHESEQKAADREVELEKARIQAATQLQIAQMREQSAMTLQRESQEASERQQQTQREHEMTTGEVKDTTDIRQTVQSHAEALMQIQQTMQALLDVSRRPRIPVKQNGKTIGARVANDEELAMFGVQP